MQYIIPIKSALIIFPIISFLFTIPFILIQYHKYGSINKLRVLIIYSFILYLLTIYFLVILPLPNPQNITTTYHDMMQVHPFRFITDFFNQTSLIITNPNTYIKALKEPCFYTVLFNIVMMIPFGMYLRYYFKCNMKSVLLKSFFLSLFFELTQLTGLYFIYPGPYRLFDVDDLILNTLGGLIGYFLMGALKKILPTREDIDTSSIETGKQVSGLRRIVVFFVDTFLLLCTYITFKIFLKISFLKIITFVFYFGLIPIILKGQTLGSKFLNVKYTSKDYLYLRLLTYQLFLYTYYFFIPFLCLTSLFFLTQIFYKFLFFLILCLIWFLFYLIHFITILIKKKIYYDYIFKINYESTIM